MPNGDNKRWYTSRWFWCTLISSIVPIIYFAYGIEQYIKIQTYVQTNCLVKKLVLQKCGTRYEGFFSKPQQCFRPIWFVKYIDYGINRTITIVDSEFWIASDHDSENIGSARKHQLDKAYPCYHSPSARLTKVQWDKPSFSIFATYMFYGTLTTLFCVCPLSIFCYYKRRHSHRARRNRTLRYTRAATSTTRGMEMRNIPSTGQLRQIRPLVPATADVFETPPPPYTPSTIAGEEECTPLTPLPPAYSPSLIHREQEENIPPTPPPAYVPSRDVTTGRSGETQPPDRDPRVTEL